MTKKVAVLGDWHLAFVTSAVLADAGHTVQLVKPLNLNSSTWTGDFPPLPVMEPGLQDMIDRNCKAGRLSYVNGIQNSLTADLVWLAVDTPVSDKDEPQLEPLLVIADQVARLKQKPQALIASSQIPLGFCHELEKRTGLSVAYVPENLRLGKGIETFYRADRTVIGSDRPETAQAVKDLMSTFPTEFLLTNAVTSEMVKHANNAFLATSISFANELARIGEKFGVDSVTVGKALKLDKRIGPAAYVIPGLGFAGGTLPRDLRVLQQLGQKEKIPTHLVDAVLQVNESTTRAISEIVQDHLAHQKLPKTVLIMGYTYKADTDTLRRSLSLDIAEDLKKSGFQIWGLDPVMNDKDLSQLQGRISHFDSLDKIQSAPSVVLLMTARPAFDKFNWKQLAALGANSQLMLVLDSQNFLKPEAVLNAGLSFKKLWSPAQRPQGTQDATR
jgi:UDPglucose 6-dehydrogenase